MAEGSVGTGHHMFVVDSQANFVSTPSTKKPRWSRVGQKLLLMLVALALLGLVVEGFFIYKLYKQNESYNLCQKMSTPKTSAQQGGTIMGRVGPEDSKEFVTVQPRQQEIQHRPFAHLMGPNSVGEKNVVQWVNDVGEAITYNMSYNNGRLSVIKDGYYYLYSKVELNAAEECSLIQHKVWKDTMAYEKSIALMISNRLVNAPLPTSFFCCCMLCLCATCSELYLSAFTYKLKRVLPSIWSSKFAF
ncbi:hypothetical protein PAMA_016116 [Pampus argenteus]